MPLFPPSLDTRRWPDLVAEARALLPLESPQWTDHNHSDPGIAVIEMLAWLVDTDVYRASRVTDRHRRKLLALLGVHPAAPSAARVVLAVRPGPGAPSELPARLGFVAHGADAATGLETTQALPLTGASVIAAGTDDGTAEQSAYTLGWTDHTPTLLGGAPVDALGPDPRAGAALVLGLDRALPAGTALALYLDTDPEPAEVAGSAPHHDAHTRWEARAGGAWQPLADVVDRTGSLTRSGAVRLRLGPAGLPVEPLGAAGTRAWVRCRLDRGRHDAPPRVRRVVADAVEAVLATAAVGAYDVASTAVLTGAAALVEGALVPLAITVDGARVVRTVRTDDPAAPVVRILRWIAPTPATPGRLVAELVAAGVGDGAPEQAFTLPGGAIAADSPTPGPHRVWLVDPVGGVEPVRLVPDLDAAGRTDLHAVLDAATGTLTFGDGRAGRVPELGRTVLAAYRTTSGARSAALAPPAPVVVAPDARTRVLLGGPPAPGALTVTLVGPAVGGTDAEDTVAAAARAERALWAHERLVDALAATEADSLDELPRAAVLRLAAPERAVTLAGVERCALDTPGTRIARVRAFAETDPRLPGLVASGCVSVVVVPTLPRGRPEPTAGLLRAVRRHLAGLRTTGTRLFVTGPRYVVVAAEVTVALLPGADPGVTAVAVRTALDTFLHPITGGPHGTGWPFGRDVHRSEVLRVLDEAPGVDHVTALALRADGGPPGCGGLCVPPTALVVPGEHAVRAVRAEVPR
ncbi:hypothetical protein [Embleya scabrispora]|uniref:hypothetical protein n=1 Tax=Embleya scabrispora TaxID=159449 RepID=UPI0003777F60|nr:hypothetical protein [Embleya scabrispora]MYS85046.1 hypothetical protein [Streptomyces sp. SID5474]